MKKKTWSILFLVIILVMAGCGKKNNTAGENKEVVNDVAMEDIHNAVKEAYGEDYIPSMSIEESMLKDTYGIEPEWCDSVIAEGPLISAQIDTFIGIKATAGNADKVKQALTTYQTNLKQDTMQYPSNLVKIQASKVVSYGDYVFFLMLGMIPMEVEEQGEDAILTAYEAENQKAIDAIEQLLITK